MYNKFLIESVAIQYHWTLDSSCLYMYLARHTDSPNYSTDPFQYWMATHPIRYIYVHIGKDHYMYVFLLKA